MTAPEALLLLAVGALAGFLNVLSAGGSMLTLPVLMFMGLDASNANGTNRVSIVLQNITAVWRFRRAGHRFRGLAWLLSVPAVLGALLGAWGAVRVGDDLFRWVLILVMIGASAIMLMPAPAQVRTLTLAPAQLRWPVLAAMFVIGFYGGFLQVAVGILFIVLLHRVLAIDLVQVNALKVTVVLIYMIPTLLIFAATGNVSWSYGLVLAAGSMTGAWAAVHVTLGPSGTILVQRFTLAVIAVIIVKLLLDLL
ncbi:Permease - like protein DUF81 [Thioalkalivibrio nitratireducens DSM 14787]|uniref:Probable membrane transporter protein n=1 Tax=Thioalkalivibrio nitratireducens (strain DSM 14787 / UNIQEM 213 / ALEN2) TaxID=1255043 RepID=L0E110_THIND|nr:sulfite exporter TauE/SafE family protein [Thioalkalivibrio nitratireducens]AGA34983.1 Permease - like protein DUF81 [Thioalkalivibrio nitratireducens DSM 14787]